MKVSVKSAVCGAQTSHSPACSAITLDSRHYDVPQVERYVDQMSRSVQMLRNVTKHNIDLFIVHIHVSSFQIHVRVQLQINLKCTDARPQII